MTVRDLDFSDLRPSDIRAIERSVNTTEALAGLRTEIWLHLDEAYGPDSTEDELEQAFILGAEISTALSPSFDAAYLLQFFLPRDENKATLAFAYGFAGQPFLDLLNVVAERSKDDRRQRLRSRGRDEPRHGTLQRSPPRPSSRLPDPESPFARLAALKRSLDDDG